MKSLSKLKKKISKDRKDIFIKSQNSKIHHKICDEDENSIYIYIDIYYNFNFNRRRFSKNDAKNI